MILVIRKIKLGWNSNLIPRDDETQKIWSLLQINISPISHAVIVEILKKSLRITAECEKQCIAVTNDLEIAKVAYHVQPEEKPDFDSTFIPLGAFYLEMVLFHAHGRFIAECGGPHILNECVVLVKGSTKSFQTSKIYNRWKRMLEILVLAVVYGKIIL